MLKLENIEVFYGKIHALKGVSLTVNEGELVALIGSNGAGKSPDLPTISGLLRLKHATLTYTDLQIDRMGPHQIVQQGLAHCSEGRSIVGSLTINENLRMLAVTQKDQAVIARARDEVSNLFPRLTERQNQLASTL